MARGRRRVNTDTLDEKIEQQKTALERAKAKYETEKENKPPIKIKPVRSAHRLDSSCYLFISDP